VVGDEQQVSGEALPSSCTWANYFLLTAPPRNKRPLEKSRGQSDVSRNND
jgi:hypothetical protein